MAACDARLAAGWLAGWLACTPERAAVSSDTHHLPFMPLALRRHRRARHRSPRPPRHRHEHNDADDGVKPYGPQGRTAAGCRVSAEVNKVIISMFIVRVNLIARLLSLLDVSRLSSDVTRRGHETHSSHAFKIQGTRVPTYGGNLFALSATRDILLLLTVP